MTTVHDNIALLRQRLNREFLSPHTRYLLPSERGNGLLLEKHLNYTARIVDGTRHIKDSVTALEHFADYCAYYGQYLLTTDKQADFGKPLAISTRYGALAITLADLGKDCLDTGISLPQDNVARYWAQTQLCGWWDEAEDIGNRLLAAFGPDGGQPRAILKPDPDDGLNGLLWFLLELYSRVKEQPIEPGALPSARFSYPYADVLQSWNTDDLDEVDRWISILSENHLKLATQGEGFTSITSWLFPYEIPAWLTARQKQGLENPAEYSHPLMQQPLAEFIPDTPLDKPDIPQVETLLQIVRNTLPAEAAFIDLGQAPANHE